ncbi:MAG TPA: FAD-dependent oxidoreductase [Vicinamibacterales bacterium]|nr:FAD-dependent oxidoreductase [Vicinamibacterales bacterium]
MTPAARSFDVLVVGGGPAGMAAATTVRQHGGNVALIDENSDGGGQVYRPQPRGFAPGSSKPTAEQRAGNRLRNALAASGADTFFEHKVWGVAPGFRVDAVGPDGPIALTASRLIAATGTSERVVPFPGWTTPGVIGLAAATILLKAQRMLPGRQTLVAGCGPLLIAVAAGIVKGGGRVAAVVDVASRGDWLGRLPALASRPDLLARGLRWMATLQAAGVPILRRHAIREVRETSAGLDVVVGPVEPDGAPRSGATRNFTVDSVAVGNGLTPASDVSRVLRAKHRYDFVKGGWIAETDDCGRTSVAGLYVVGDGAGIAGAAAAEHHGAAAGIAAVQDFGRIDVTVYRRQVRRVGAKLDRAGRFGRAMAGMMAIRPAQVAAITRDTLVCRCEDVTRAEIEQAVDDGATEVNQVKAWTRCGMGPCQGRTCGDVVAEIVARRVGGREAAGYFTGRLPLRPVSLQTVIGDYVYADIPIPKEAPL